MKYFYFLLVPLFALGAGCSMSTQDPSLSNAPVSENPPAETSESMAEDANMDSNTVKTYTLEEVALHSTPDDCWFAIDGKVYDVSGYGERHPGSDAVYEGCGKDATTFFETRPMGSGTPHSDRARGFLPNFEIGILE